MTKSCNIQQQSDEMFCSTCSLRWGVAEDQPECTIDKLNRQIYNIEMTGRINGEDKVVYQQLKSKLRGLTA